MTSKKTHWDEVYSTKNVTEVSWYEPMPEVSLKCIADCKLEKDDAIIDIGGGDSFLAEFLLAKDFTNITVLDISSKAIERAKTRLGDRADEIEWIVTDVVSFEPSKKYRLWHDRAAFHFLTSDEEVEQYVQKLLNAIEPGGFVILGTFSDKGPEKCSGLPIRQYSIAQMQELLQDGFVCLNSKNVDHNTPSGGVQNFTFCTFQKKE